MGAKTSVYLAWWMPAASLFPSDFSSVVGTVTHLYFLRMKKGGQICKHRSSPEPRGACLYVDEIVQSLSSTQLWDLNAAFKIGALGPILSLPILGSTSINCLKVVGRAVNHLSIYQSLLRLSLLGKFSAGKELRWRVSNIWVMLAQIWV